MRILDYEDGRVAYDCFCELQGGDRRADRKGPNRMAITSSDGKNHCWGFVLDRAVANKNVMYVDAMIDDETDVLAVMAWSPAAVRKSSPCI